MRNVSANLRFKMEGRSISEKKSTKIYFFQKKVQGLGETFSLNFGKIDVRVFCD